jgi:hypothetical protein
MYAKKHPQMPIAWPEKTCVRAGGTNPNTINIAHHGTILTSAAEHVEYSLFFGPGLRRDRN